MLRIWFRRLREREAHEKTASIAEILLKSVMLTLPRLQDLDSTVPLLTKASHLGANFVVGVSSFEEMFGGFGKTS
jgi:hypothetical protein